MYIYIYVYIYVYIYIYINIMSLACKLCCNSLAHIRNKAR